MADTILRFIVSAIEVALELLVQHTGKKVLSLWGRKPTPLPSLAAVTSSPGSMSNIR
jgi:hypothetical protein